KLMLLAAIGGIVALVCIFKWLWQSESAPTDRLYAIGGDVELPDHMTGSRSHSWWAMVVLMLVDGTIFACLIFSYFYLWTVTDSPGPPGSVEVPDVALCVGAAAAWRASSALWAFANRRLRVGAARGVLIGSIAATLPLAWVAFMLTMQAIGAANVQPDAHAYGAVLYAMLSWQGLYAVLGMRMGGCTTP